MTSFRFNSLITAVLALLIFTAVTYTSCKKDEDNGPGSVDTERINVNCNNGSCLDGLCACNTGWEGVYCDIKVVNRYLGNWSAIETITLSSDLTTVGDTFSYIFSIVPNGNDLLSFKIAGLMGSDDTIVAQLGDPKTHLYNRLSYFFQFQAMNDVSPDIPLVYISAGAGRISSSGATMDSMAYGRHYEVVNGSDTVFHEDSVRVVAQKI